MSDSIERNRLLSIELTDDSQIDAEISVRLSVPDYRTLANDRLNKCNIALIMQDLQDSICRNLGIDPANLVEATPTGYDNNEDDDDELEDDD